MEFAVLMRRKMCRFSLVDTRRFSNFLTQNGDYKSAPQTVKKYFVCTPEAMPPECNSWTVFCPVDSFKQAKWRGTVTCVLVYKLCFRDFLQQNVSKNSIKTRNLETFRPTHRTPHAAKPRTKLMKIWYTGSAEQGRGTVCCICASVEHDHGCL